MTPFRLTPADADRYARLRMTMLTEAPWAFNASPGDDFWSEPDKVAAVLSQEQNALFGVEAEDSRNLIAASGITRMERTKFSHRARLWGVFVQPDLRSGGLGRAVVSATIDLARTWPGLEFIDLGVSENSPEARQLYESLGFQPWGREPGAVGIGGQRLDEIHMTLKL